MNISGFMIDAFLIIIFLFSIIQGKSKGFFRITITLVFSIIALVLAKAMAEPVGQWITDNLIHERLVAYFSNILEENIANGSNAAISAMPDYLVSAANDAGFSLKTILGSSFTDSQITSLSTKLATTFETVLKPLINGAGYAIVFVCFKVVSSVAASFLSVIFKLPIIKQVNKLLGLVFGALKGLIIILVISSLLMLFGNCFSTSEFAEAINSSNIVHIFGGILTGIIVG